MHRVGRGLIRCKAPVGWPTGKRRRGRIRRFRTLVEAQEVEVFPKGWVFLVVLGFFGVLFRVGFLIAIIRHGCHGWGSWLILTGDGTRHRAVSHPSWGFLEARRLISVSRIDAIAEVVSLMWRIGAAQLVRVSDQVLKLVGLLARTPSVTSQFG